MKLHEDKKLFRQAVQFASDQMKLPAIYVEKDYWVTLALYSIFNSSIGADTIFKGGTSLSKCHGLIDRFSEDIDLVVLRHDGEPDARMKAKLKEVSNVVSTILPEIEVPELTNKKGMNRKTAHAYQKEFQGNYGQIRDLVIVESSWLGYHEPSSQRQIQSFVGVHMAGSGQADLAESHGMVPFTASVLEPSRTICEKIMSLVRFSYVENPIEVLKMKIRHAYDLHRLLSQPDLSAFFESTTFEEMLLRVANDDARSYKNNNEWLANHPNKSLLFANLEEVWSSLKSAYTSDFRNLVYGELPPEQDILATLQRIKTRLAGIAWKVTIPVA